jgi:hypothetical protein
MKTTLSKLFMLSMAVVLFGSCKKDDARDYFQGGSAPVLSADVSGTIPLSYNNRSNEAVMLSWTNPNYQFTSGISSQDVAYLVEIDTTGANFTNPARQSISVSKDLSLTVTQGTFNDYMLNQLQLASGVSHNVEIRVTSTIGVNSGKLLSNVLKFAVTPYAIPPKITPPASGELYITGSAVASNWTNSPPASQKFTRVSNTLYEITVPLTGNNSYTFLPTYGSWNDKYSIAVKNDPNEIYGGDFQWQGNDILAPPVSGNYKISVDFQRGKFTVTKQ